MVKWKMQPYDACTWETEAFLRAIPDGPQQIKYVENLKLVSQEGKKNNLN